MSVENPYKVLYMVSYSPYMALPEIKGWIFYLFNRYWWLFAIIGAIIVIFIAKEMFFYLYFNYYLRSKEEKKLSRKHTRGPSEEIRDFSVAYALGKISAQEFDALKNRMNDSLPVADKQKQIKEKIGSIVATEDIHNLLSQLERKEEKSAPEPQKEVVLKREEPKEEKEQEEKHEDKPEEIRRLMMRKARLILAIKKLDEDFSAGKISSEVHRKQRVEFISELADTEEALIEYEVKKKTGKKGI